MGINFVPLFQRREFPTNPDNIHPSPVKNQPREIWILARATVNPVISSVKAAALMTISASSLNLLSISIVTSFHLLRPLLYQRKNKKNKSKSKWLLLGHVRVLDRFILFENPLNHRQRRLYHQVQPWLALVCSLLIFIEY